MADRAAVIDMVGRQCHLSPPPAQPVGEAIVTTRYVGADEAYHDQADRMVTARRRADVRARGRKGA